MANEDGKQMKVAKKVRFYRNGDGFFDGLHFAVGDRFRTFESLLATLTTSSLCDNRVLPKGVRYLFSLDGRKITSLDELQDGEAYVTSSIDAFKKLDYAKVATPNWNPSVRGTAQKLSDEFSKKRTDAVATEAVRESDSVQKGRVLVVVRNGIKPRKVARVLLNTRTAHSFEQVLDMIGTSFHMPPVKKLFTFDRKQITTLAELLQTDSTVLAYGAELKSDSDFVLTDLELQSLRAVSSYSGAPPSADVSRKNSTPDVKRGSTTNIARCSSAPGTPRQNRRNNGNASDTAKKDSDPDADGSSGGRQLSLFGSAGKKNDGNDNPLKNGSHQTSTGQTRECDELF